MTRIALLDWDGTMRKNYTIRSWVKFLIEQGAFHESATKNLEAVFQSYQRGEITHDQTAIDTSTVYARYLEGHSVEEISSLAAAYLETDMGYLNSFSSDLIHKLRQYDIQVYVVSGAPYEVLVNYMKIFPMNGMYSLGIRMDKATRYTSEVLSNPGTSQTKKDCLEILLRKVNSRVVFAAGDSVSDLPLLNAATYCLVVNNPNLEVSGKPWYLSTEDEMSTTELLAFLESEVVHA